MLAHATAIATVAVSDLEAARQFYEGVLGLRREEGGEPEAISYSAAGSQLLVYRSRHAGTNRATSVTWSVGQDIEALVRRLSAKGVTFEHYDMPDMTLKGDVHVAERLKVAWFKDPDGNIHALVSG